MTMVEQMARQMVETKENDTETRIVTLLYRGKAIDYFPATGDRIRLPKHITDHFFSSNEFEIQL